jgi:protein-disulfide isomerase
VQGTPTFFINVVRYDGFYHLDALLAAIEDELGKIPESDSG